ncbi:CopD family protein [Paraburkholderia strydomiana]|uniref:copper resistance D family protein n=1 Tax=Paraburkholderia strydomiana TaxID=1245417 RepID=UPI0038B8BC0C
MNDGFLGILRLASVALQNISFAILIGVLLSDRWLSRSTSRWQTSVSAHLLLTLRIASFTALVSSAFAFWIHCALMSESTLEEAGPAARAMLVETDFGHAWLAGAGFMLLVVILSLVQARRPIRFKPAIWLALAGVALARSHGGHPIDAGAFSIPVWVDWVHLLAVSVWVGLVLVATYIVMPRICRAPAAERADTAAFIQSLSDAATLALAAIFITGAYSGWRGVNAAEYLWTSTYGRVLIVKLALVGIAAALGGHNRFFEMPQLLTSLRETSTEFTARPLKRFAAVLHVESIVLAAVLVTAAVLVSSPLPGTT